ncbi:Beta--glucosyltransferase [Oopsacas minuta]|uniref:N-acetylgalactosaminide beta-1,3-galactosyltransferase n=1 Tax=Oopsacas minuta TaxID=111878 RepID=A0AAV7JNX7_9METZ|nr:Beta--glucosyltransferase [Oopsacas minuta]
MIFKYLLLFVFYKYSVWAIDDFGFDVLNLRQEIEAVKVEILGTNNASFDVLIIVRSQVGEYHQKRLEQFEGNLRKQIHDEYTLIFAIVCLHEIETVVQGSWTLIPLIQHEFRFVQSAKWVIITEDSTELNLSKLSSFLSTKDPVLPQYFGHCIIDKKPVIIHHFWPYTMDKITLKYPLFASGVIFSQTVVRYLSELDMDDHIPSNIPYTTIDIQHEIAKLISTTQLVNLTCEESFCVEKDRHCMTWVNVQMNKGCENKDYTYEGLSIAVKTYAENYSTRLQLIIKTWLSDTRDITKFFTHSLENTSQFDGEINFIDVGFNNTGGGHCQKMLFIMKYFLQNEKGHWLAIIDDDTFINMERLTRILSCINPESEAIILGERYGFLQIEDGGYPYITGGGGILINRKAIRKFIDEDVYCPVGAPDDMWLGMHSKVHGIIMLDFPNFHQSVESTYHKDYIKSFMPVTYHRIGTVKEYEDTLKG